MSEVAHIFSLDHLDALKRDGVRNVETKGSRAGCWVAFDNGWTLSVQWGSCNYGSNRDVSFDIDQLTLTAELAEVAAWPEGGGMVTWAEGDTVQGWCSMERVWAIIDLIAAGDLMRAHDGWVDR